MYCITALLHFVLGNNIFWAQLHFRKTFAHQEAQTQTSEHAWACMVI